MSKQLTMINGEAVDLTDVTDGMALRCSTCGTRTAPVQRDGDPATVVRCGDCGKKHSTDSLVVDA